MPLSVEAEVDQIESMTDLKQVRDKRTGRKGQITKISTQVQILIHNSTKTLRLSQLRRKLEELNRSIALFDALQSRLEALATEQPDFDLEAEVLQGNQTRTDNEEVAELLITTIEKVELYLQGSKVLQSLTDLAETEDSASSYLSMEIHQLSEEADKFRAEAELYSDDEDLHAVSRKLTSLKRRVIRNVKNPETHSIESTSVAAEPVACHKDRFKLQPPTYDGKPLEWKRFIRLFKAIIAKDPSLDEAEKACLLLNSMTISEAKELVKTASTGEHPFESALEALRLKYGKERVIYKEHLKALMVDRTFGYNLRDLNFIVEHWNKHLKGLEECDGLNCSNVFATLLELKFDDDLRHQWNVGGSTDPEKPSNIEDLLKFVKARSNSDLVDEEPSASNQPRKSNPRKNEPRRENSHRPSQPTTTFKCLACKQEGHTLSRCDTFRTWDFNRKNQLVRDHKLCLNCFSNRHAVRDCKSLYSCRTCKARHHSLLHKDSANDPPAFLISDGTQYLTTAIAMVMHGDYRQKVRVVLDSGACVNVMTEDLARRLKAKRLPCSERVNFGPYPHSIKSFVELQLSSAHEEGRVSDTIRAYIIPSIPSARPPANATQLLELPFIKGKTPIADAQLGGPVDILLSTRDGGDCIIGGSLQYKNPTTTLTRTIFGWALGGGTTSQPSQWDPVLSIHPDDSELFDSLQRLWQLDRVPSRETPLMEDEEKQAVDHFRTTHKVLESGRFSVQLPRKTPTPTLGESRPAAVRRYIQNEKTLQKRGQLSEFQDVLKEYITLGHAEKVPPDEISIAPSTSFYLPVHGVIKESSTTTRLRAVFDASAKTSSGVALNEQLLPGPNLYPLLTTILNRFRVHKVAITSDISKMFREIELQPSERDYHRFLLRENGKLVDCRMKRLTFGVTSSPFLATKVLRQLADNKQIEFPLASAVVKESFYVDDCLVGANSVQEAAQLREKLCQLLETAGMNLRKWRSNSKDLLSSIPEDLREKSDLDIVDHSSSSKALGLHWHVETDQLYVPVPELPTDMKITKRSIASVTAKVFDVLGFFAPSVLQAKLILQQLWSLRVKWDTEVPEDIKCQWINWTSQLHIIANQPIHRSFTQHNRSILYQQLHGFSDASTLAYGGVVYLRTVFDDTRVEVTLVTSKSRVAPLKTVTIPRLELVAAVLTAKLLITIASDLHIPMASIFAWTDSTIVLNWFKKQLTRLPTFVSNRVVQTLDLVPEPQWRHVPTSQNPADLSSRGASPEMLIHSTLWWKGPPWLSESPEDWPTSSPATSENQVTDATSVLNIGRSETNELWHRYSQFSRLVRIVAWCRRFTTNCSRNTNNKQLASNLTHQEVDNARRLLLVLSQKESFMEVFDLLNQKKSLPRSHPLSRLTLQLSEDGLIRVCSRVRDDLQPQHPRFYTLLSITSTLTKLFVTSLHADLGHPGTSTLLAAMAEDFYIPRIKSFLKALSRKCVICQKAYIRTSNQQMGMLPLDRTKPLPPFHSVGIDFAGPFVIRRGNPRKPTKVKVYACLFVCLATRAIHLELCSDLSSNAFMATFQRFCARRGTPSHVFSDNGTNFVGTYNELSDLQKLLNSETSKNKIANLSSYIQWHFSPARSPHFGGLWESGVRAMKTLLRKNLKPHLLTFEELNTILIQAEAILNSRPIIPLETTEANGLTSLTAGHFLIGRPLIAPPTHSSDSSNISLLRRWNLVERLNADLWTQWRHRYLQSLHSRTKWRQPQRNFSVGDIVLVKDATLVQRSWPLGKIVDTHPGDDGLVRVVKIICNGSTFTRSVNRLVLLVSNDDQPQSRPPVCSGSASSLNNGSAGYPAAGSSSSLHQLSTGIQNN